MIKRMVDLGASAILLLLLSPLMAVVALLIRTKMGAPVLFKQVRPGLSEKPFTLVKFRSMTSATGPDGRLLPDSQRMTPLGRFLRRTSMDELPQLWNVLKGDMSLVGPRPLLMEYLARYTPEQHRRHEVRPGMTGLGVVKGRDLLKFSERIQLDVWYVDHASLWLDLTILLRTAIQVISGTGVVLDQNYEVINDLPQPDAK